MKIYNDGTKFNEVLFACNRCGTVWSATPSYNYDFNRSPNQAFFAWRNEHPLEDKYYNVSKSGKTFMCDCPNCGKYVKTPVSLHNAYMAYGKKLG